MPDMRQIEGTNNEEKPESIVPTTTEPSATVLEPLEVDPHHVGSKEPKEHSHPQVNEMVDPKIVQHLHREIDGLSREVEELRKKYDDKRYDLKMADREIGEQIREMRDLKKQNAELRDALRVMDGLTDKQKDEVQMERDQLYEHIEMLDNNIMHFKSELHKRRLHMESLTQQTRDAIDQKVEAENVARRLARENRNLNENLTECKDDLLRLQPPSQISDSELSEQYSSLHQQISKWVDDETEDSQLLEQRFEDLSNGKEDPPELLRKYIGGELLRLGKKHANSLPLILRYVIHHHLDQHVFRDDIHLFGLDNRNTQFLRGIEQGMKKLEPQRDAKTIQHWRSETLRALAQAADFKDEQRDQAISISQSLYTALSYFIPNADARKEGWKELYEHIVNPAVQVAANMRLSTESYRTTSRMAGKHPDQSFIMFIHEVQRCDMMDISSHKIVRPDSALKVGDNGRIGDQMLVVQPALIRSQKDGGPSVVLCKPTMLVRLDEPMGRRNKGIKSLASWFGGDAASI